MKKKLKKGFLYLSLGLVGFFLFRLGYGYLYPVDSYYYQRAQSFSGDFDFSKKNYANEKIKIDRAQDGSSYNVDQKYEKIASLASQSTSFNEDEKKVRELCVKYNALIQLEQSSGLEGHRLLNLAIGVPPEKFDEMVSAIQTIGHLDSLRIDKSDKTNEYKDLNAKRVSLEKTRDALLKLKGVSAPIDESINLENRILEIETEIQAMGVKLGEYDQENEFCTVKFSLEERRGAQAGIPFLKRVKVSLEWTLKYYFVFVSILCVGSMLLWVAILILEKVKFIASAIETAKRGDLE